MNENKLYVKNINGYYLKDEDAREELENKSDIGHTHTKSEITDFTHSHDLSDLNNDTGFIDKDVNNLTNYTNNTNLIGAILESGSSQNGKDHYIKFADGTMVCYGTWSIGGTSTNGQQTGSLYYVDISLYHNFPASFISAPVLEISFIDSHLDANHSIFSQLKPDSIEATRFGDIRILSAINTTLNVDCNYIAIGKWK